MNLRKPIYAWYAIYTKVNQEKKIFSNLKEANIECYLPLSKSLKQWSDRKKWIEEPLFRCYLFVKVSYIEFFNVLSSTGVVRYVSFGGSPQTIPDSQIENIQTFIEQAEKDMVLTRKHIAKGAKAEVLYGPLKGIKGEVVHICGQSRILIRVESMGCCLYTNISRDEIKLLNPNIVKKTVNNKSAKRLIRIR